MKLNLLYLHNPMLGYGRYGTDLANALTQQGVHIDDQLTAATTDPANVACWVSTPNHTEGWQQGQRTVLSTMWEAMTLPEMFRENLHNFDQLIVPSAHNLELFSRYHPNVAQVPLAIDTARWHHQPRRPPTDRFVFLTGGSGARKGGDLVYRAFRKLWPTEQSWPKDAPRPTLIIKTPKTADWYAPRVEQVTGHITDQAETDLYAMAHCYVQPSRGEGFGLQPLQAIAQGLPTVLTDAHGHREFAHLGWGISAGTSKAAYFIHGDAGTWWEPAFDELCDRMLWVYDHYDDACQVAAISSQVAHLRYNWDRCANLFLDAVGRDRLDTPYHGDRTWITPTLKRFPVAVNKRWRCEIAGTVYQFDPGETTWEPANVKRILFEAGVLDESCIVTDPTGPVTETESGLAPEQIERLGAYTASHKHCWQCGQILGTGVRYEPEPV